MARSRRSTRSTASSTGGPEPARGRERRASGQRAAGKRGTVRADHLAVPAERVLRRAALRREIDVDQPEALAVTLRPFEVVEQAPREVAAHVGAARARERELTEVALHVVDALGI